MKYINCAHILVLQKNISQEYDLIFHISIIVVKDYQQYYEIERVISTDSISFSLYNLC